MNIIASISKLCNIEQSIYNTNFSIIHNSIRDRSATYIKIDYKKKPNRDQQKKNKAKDPLRRER